MTDFERGAEAMREACISVVKHCHIMGSSIIGNAIRLLPLPVPPPGSESREARLEKALDEMVKLAKIEWDSRTPAGTVQRGIANQIHQVRSRALAPDARPEEKK